MTRKNRVFNAVPNLSFARTLMLFVLSCFLCSAVANERAQNVQFKHLGPDNGLSQETIYQILQDKYGFMWFATSEGLNRYDGHEFTSFLHNPKATNSISNDWIWALHTSDDGALWIGTDGGGLNRLRDDGSSFDHFKFDINNPESISGDKVRVIADDQSGNLWIGTDSGLNRFDVATQTFERLVHDNEDPYSLSSNKIRAILQEQHGSLWIGTDGGGLNQMDIPRKTVRHFRHNPNDINSISSDRIRSIFETLDGILWIGTYDKGVNRYNPRTGHVKRYTIDTGHGLSSNIVRDIKQDHLGILWLATDNGLYEYRSESDRFVRYHNDPADVKSLGDNRAMSLYQDAGKVLWVGTQAGINMWNYQTTSFELFRQSALPDQGLRSKNILSFAQSDANTLWVGTYAGLHKYNELKGTFEVFDKSTGLPDERIMSLAVQEQFLWVGTFKSGLVKFHIPSGEMKHYPPQSHNDNWINKGGITSLSVDNLGQLWVGNFGGGLYKYNKLTDNFKRYQHNPDDPKSLQNNRVIAVQATQNNEIWLSLLGKGIARLIPSTGEITHYSHDVNNDNTLASNTNWVIYEDKQANIWLGSQGGGLSKLSNEQRRTKSPTFERVTRLEGLKSNVIYGIEQDVKGDLWLSTNRGITRYSPESSYMRHFGVHHGLQALEFNSSSHFKNSSGKLFFGGSNGFNAFYPTEIQRNEHPPQVALTKILKVNEKLKTDTVVHKLEQLTLSAEDYLLSFEFAALDFASANNNHYRYMLEGYDSQWIENQTVNRASYTNLPSGNFVFRVQASNNDGLWNEQGISLNLTVLPPWYLSTLAKFSYGFVFLVFMALLYKLHLRRLFNEAKNSRRLEQIVAERTEAMHQKSKQLQIRNDELKTLNHRLAEATVSDSLTGLHNRRFVADYMQKVTQNLERRLEKMSLSEVLANNRPIFFLVIDIDKFTHLNETYGHEAGDQVLLIVARILGKHCRSADILARWGSDSFLLAGETDDVDAILKLARRLLNNIDQSKAVFGNKSINISCSAGITYYPFSISQPSLFNWEQVISLSECMVKFSQKQNPGHWACMRAGQLGLARSDFQNLLHDPLLMAEKQAVHLVIEEPVTVESAGESAGELAEVKNDEV